MANTASAAPPRIEDRNDLGFGSAVSAESRQRLLTRDGTINVRRRKFDEAALPG